MNQLNNNSKTSDIDRSLAIFYHPLFQEVTSQWTFALFRKNKVDNLENYKHPQDFQMNFLEFIEFNLKVQKSLLPQFDLSNAFVSALNDWVKEITECFNYQDLYSSNETDVLSLKQEIERRSQNIGIETIMNEYNSLKQLLEQKQQFWNDSLTLPSEEYLKFIDMFKEHEAFKIVKFHITNEVFCKFLFDLCTTWCEYLDIEMFILFLFSIFLQISEGEEGIKDSELKNTLEIENLKFEFFEEFEKQKDIYQKQKKKSLRYYRAWCEWNYLRLNEMGESVILKLSEIFGEDEEERIYDLVSIFEKAIDTINNEITTQMGKSTSQNQTFDNSPDKSNKFKNNKQVVIDKGVKSSIHTHGLMQAQQPSTNLQQQESFQKLGEGKDLIRQKLKDMSQKEQQSAQLQQQQQQLKINQAIQMQEQYNQQYNSSKQQQFEIDYDERGNIVMKKIVKIPVLGKHLNPLPKSQDNSKIYYKNKQEKPVQFYHIDQSFLIQKQKRNSSTQPNRRSVNNSFQDGSSFFQQKREQQGQSQTDSPQKILDQNQNNSTNNILQNQYHSVALSSRGSSRQKSIKNSFMGLTTAAVADNNQSVNINNTHKTYQNPLLEKEQLKLLNQAQKEKDVDKSFQKEAIEAHLRKGYTQESPISNKLPPRKDIRILKKVLPGSTDFNNQIINENLNNSRRKLQKEIQEQDQYIQSNSPDNQIEQIIEESSYNQQSNKTKSQQLEEIQKVRQLDQRIQTEIIEFGRQNQNTSPKFDTPDNSVLVPEFLRNMKAKMIEKEQLQKNLNIFDKELRILNKQDPLNEFSNSIYQTKRNPQMDISKRVLGNPQFVGKDELREKVNKSFDKGKGKIQQIEQILEPNQTSMNLIKKNKKQQSKGERLLASPSRRFNQRDYQYEVLLDNQLNKIKEKSMIQTQQQQNGNNDTEKIQPNQNIDYKRAVDRYKNVWKKYLSEQDMYMLNDWDSLYKIIIILKRKFAQDHRENYLDFLNLDIAQPNYPQSQQDVDETSTQASGEHETRFVLDKEKFQKTIQRLLKRDERRKKRRRQKRRLKQGTGQTQQPYDIFKEKRKKFQLTKFRSKSNKQLFKDVFLLPQIANKN